MNRVHSLSDEEVKALQRLAVLGILSARSADRPTLRRLWAIKESSSCGIDDGFEAKRLACSEVIEFERQGHPGS